MLVQKKSASRKMIILWSGIGAVVLVAGFLVYQNVIVLGNAVKTTAMKDRISRLDIPSDFGDELFLDPRLNNLIGADDQDGGYISQHSVTASSSDSLQAPSEISVSDPGYGGKLFVSWSAAEAQVTGYAILRASGSFGDFAQVAFVKAHDFPTYIDTDVVNNQAYSYRIQSVNVTELTKKEKLSVGSDDGFISIESASAGGNVITWSSVEGEKASQVSRWRNGEAQVIATLREQETIYYDVEGDSTDAYSVVWYSSYSESPLSDTSSATPTDSTPPQAPTDVRIENTGSGSSIAVFWTNPLDPDFDYVHIYRSTSQGFLGESIKSSRSTYTVIGESCVLLSEDEISKVRASMPSLGADDALPEQNCFIDEVGVSEGETYFYSLVSYDLLGNHSISNIISEYGKEDPFASVN